MADRSSPDRAPSQSTHRPSLLIALRASPRLLTAQLALHCCALIAAWAVTPLWWALALSVGLLASALSVWYRYRGRGAGFVDRLSFGGGGWRARTGDGRWHRLSLLDYRCLPALLVLNFRRRDGRRRCRVVICSDSADADARRRLRQRLLQSGSLIGAEFTD